jgi:hypothetical protein
MPPLDDLVSCDRFGHLSARACRRRQLERRLVEDAKGKKRPGPFVYERCASGECVKGEAVAADLRRLEVLTSTCATCGSAYVGPEAAAPCPSCSPGKLLPEKRRGEISTRIWSGEVPNTGIAPPTHRDAGLTVAQEQGIAARLAAAAPKDRRSVRVEAPPPAGAELIARRDAYDAAIDRRVALAEEELAALKTAQGKARARAETATA